MCESREKQALSTACIHFVRPRGQERVDRLQEILEAVGVSVWRDTKDLWPSRNWEDQIRAVIKSESLGVHNVLLRAHGGKDEECIVPDYNLGAGRTLVIVSSISGPRGAVEPGPLATRSPLKRFGWLNVPAACAPGAEHFRCSGRFDVVMAPGLGLSRKGCTRQAPSSL